MAKTFRCRCFPPEPKGKAMTELEWIMKLCELENQMRGVINELDRLAADMDNPRMASDLYAVMRTFVEPYAKLERVADSYSPELEL